MYKLSTWYRQHSYGSKQFKSIKAMSQYMRRNTDKETVYKRYIKSGNTWEMFTIYQGKIITKSTAEALLKAVRE